MSDRMIRITHCTGCPHRDHRGALAAIPCIPFCRKAKRELPYTVGKASPTARVGAIQTPGIPDWCPLDLAPQVQAAQAAAPTPASNA